MVELYIKLYQFLETSYFADCCYIVVQAGLGFDIDTGAALCLTVAGRWQIFVEVAAEVITEVAAEIATEVAAKVVAEAAGGLGYYL